MLKPYRTLVVVQGSCSVLHNDALGFARISMVVLVFCLGV